MSLTQKNTTRKLGRKSAKLGAVLALVASTPFMTGLVPWAPHAVTNATTQGLADLDGKVLAQIMTQSAGYTNTIRDNTSLINDALVVAISQEAATAQHIAVQDRKTKQVATAAIQAQHIADDMLDVQLDYGAATGQGFDVCRVLAENQQLDRAAASVDVVAAEKVLNTDNAPGAVAKDNKLVVAKRQAIHDSNYCSAAEKDGDKCTTVSPVPNADTNANVLFTSARPGTKVAEAKAAVRQNILGSPTLSVPEAAAASAVGQAYLANVNRKTALSAFPAYSLAYLESMSEKRDDLKDKEGNPQSPNDVLHKTVTRYYGGPDSQEWVKKMIAQQPRGLLVELAKMEGLSAWMTHQQYLANQRLEGNIAAMTITTALPMEEALKRQELELKNRATSSLLSR